jgi:hypothetical protein
MSDAMNTSSTKPLTHTSYAAAQADLKAGKSRFARWSAGEGFIAEGEWNPRTKRVQTRLYNPDGSRCA